MSPEQEKKDDFSENQSMAAEKSFAAMMNETMVEPDFFEPGQKVEGTVVRIDKEWVFLDIGGKSEGVLAASEMLDNEGRPTVGEGDVVEAYFLTVERNEKIFTTRMSGAVARAHLQEAFRSRIPLEGRVTKEIKGGYEIKIGAVRAFCPYSQMGLRRVEDSGRFVDQELVFKIIEYKENGRNIIVSQRLVLEEERAEQKEKLKETLKPGMTVSGTITSLRDFGAFIDIGAVEGLIPVSEISWGRVEDIHATLEVGQQVEVAVMKLDWDKDRYSFSLKQTLPDPWESAVQQFQVGKNYSGRVARLTDFGAFVTLAPGIDGLVHISNLGGGRRINHPREVVQAGDTLEVRIDALDLKEKRISLSLPQQEGQEKKTEQKKGPRKKNKPERDEENKADYREYAAQEKSGSGDSMGTFADLLKQKMSGK